MLDCPLQTAFSRLYSARRDVNAALRRAGWTAGFFGPTDVPVSTGAATAAGGTVLLMAAAAALMMVAPPARGATLTQNQSAAVPLAPVLAPTPSPTLAAAPTPDPIRPLSVHYQPAWRALLADRGLEGGTPTSHARSTKKLPPPLVKPQIVWPSDPGIGRPDRAASNKARSCKLLEREAKVLKRLIRNTPRSDLRRASYIHRLTMLYAELDDHVEEVIRRYDDTLATCDKRQS